MTTHLDTLELVLDAMFADPATARARVVKFKTAELRDFALALGVDHKTRWWGTLLQEYRQKETFRYRVVCQGYGRAAMWRVFARVDHPTVSKLRFSKDHEVYLVQDAIKKEWRDRAFEWAPSVLANEGERADIQFRLDEFRVNAVHRLEAAGMERTAAIVWLEELMAS